MTVSGATVTVYSGNNNEPDYVFSITVEGNGRYWTVFKYNTVTRSITPVNIISSGVAQ